MLFFFVFGFVFLQFSSHNDWKFNLHSKGGVKPTTWLPNRRNNHNFDDFYSHLDEIWQNGHDYLARNCEQIHKGMSSGLPSYWQPVISVFFHHSFFNFSLCSSFSFLFVSPRWPNDGMQVFGASEKVSFLKPEAPSVLFSDSQWKWHGVHKTLPECAFKGAERWHFCWQTRHIPGENNLSPF